MFRGQYFLNKMFWNISLEELILTYFLESKIHILS